MHVSIPADSNRGRPGLTLCRRAVLARTRCHGIPTTPPIETLIDLAAQLSTPQLEAAINEADKRDLVYPEQQHYVNGFRTDFSWPGLRLVVETDGGRFHRTAAQQTADRIRDQTHAAAGLTPLRFTHAQIASDPDRVEAVLTAVAARLNSRAGAPAPGRTASPDPRPC